MYIWFEIYYFIVNTSIIHKAKINKVNQYFTEYL